VSSLLQPIRRQMATAAPRRRMMARPSQERAPHRRHRRWRSLGRYDLLAVGLFAFVSVVALAALSALPAITAQQTGNSRPPAVGPGVSPAASADLGASPTASPQASRTPRTGPASPAPSATDKPQQSTPEASPARAAAAPASAADFDGKGQIISIAFPLREQTRYRYRDNWGDLRVGAPEPYNHAHSRRQGETLRAHDGIDIYAPVGEPVISPFDGVVIDPAERWQPWRRDRYGRVAVVLSEEPTSAGYAALMSHLDKLWVEPGQPVKRGEILGTVGSSGNAEGGRAHVHFELRAPFEISWDELGEERLVDAFNPFSSLVSADPKRSD
jgi:murein DD-endopeptidase MepM/ murein hydrolase activator NlpD